METDGSTMTGFPLVRDGGRRPRPGRLYCPRSETQGARPFRIGVWPRIGPLTSTQSPLESGPLLHVVPDTASNGTSGVAGSEQLATTQPSPEPIDQTAAATKQTSWTTVVRYALIVVALASIGMVFQLAYVSGLQHRSAQVALYNQFRTELALGTAPLGPKVGHHQTLALGKPMAQITIPSIGVNQIVLEGTTGSVLANGPGHLRSTVFPGGTGDSIILGRDGAYGGPFGKIHDLRKGATITVVTQVGTSVYRVTDIHQAGTKVRPVSPGNSRLTLETASGTTYAPTGVVEVDADNVGAPLPAQRPVVKTVPAEEQPLGLDTGTLWALGLWVLILAAVVAGGVVTWRRRGRAQAWIIFTAPVLLIWMYVADQFARLLPNLL